MNVNKTEYMCFKEGVISTWSWKQMKLVDQFTYFGSNISSTETDVNIHRGKACTTIDRLSFIWKSVLSDKIKWDFLLAVVVPLLMYGCTTWMLMKCIQKRLEKNYTIMLHSISNKFLKEHPHKTAAVRPLTSHLTNYSNVRYWP